MRQVGLRVVHVRVPVPVYPGPTFTSPYVAPLDRIEEAAHRVVEDEVRDGLGEVPDVDLELRVVAGAAVPVLLEAAQDAQLLVVGRRGHGGFAGLLLGSGAARVCTTPRVP